MEQHEPTSLTGAFTTHQFGGAAEAQGIHTYTSILYIYMHIYIVLIGFSFVFRVANSGRNLTSFVGVESVYRWLSFVLQVSLTPYPHA